MARATTKKELILTGNEQFKKMCELIDSMSEADQNKLFNFNDDIGKEAHWKRDKNIRDVFIHLYEWHELLLNWVDANKNGNSKPFLPQPYNWKTYGDMNVEFWKKHQNTSYNSSKEMIKETHIKVMKLLDTFSNEELFTKGYFVWTGGSTLSQYFISVTSSHYMWALKKIKSHIKTIKT